MSMHPDIRESLERGLASHREALVQAEEWWEYAAKAVAYYEEWLKTGELPSRPFPSYYPPKDQS